jgi:hypothetical protein
MHKHAPPTDPEEAYKMYKAMEGACLILVALDETMKMLEDVAPTKTITRDSIRSFIQQFREWRASKHPVKFALISDGTQWWIEDDEYTEMFAKTSIANVSKWMEDNP